MGRFRAGTPGRAARLLATLAAVTAVGCGLPVAAEAAVRVQPVDVAAGRPAAPGGTFQLVGARWAGAGSVEARVRLASGRWTRWFALSPEAPAWTGDATAVEARTAGDVRGLHVAAIVSPRLPGDDALPRADAPADAAAASIAGIVEANNAGVRQPAIVSRRGWGADESIRRGEPDYADGVRMAFVHHTVTPTVYSCASSAAYVRGIYAFHVKGNKWSDIGYNFLVDRCGRIFEGRYGGISRPVIGAHSLGFNTNSTGIAMLGTFDRSAPPARALGALSRLLAWRLDLAHVDPRGDAWMTNRGSPSYRPGRLVRFRAVSGHRDGSPTSCPGAALYARLDGVAADARRIGGLKLWEPRRRGKLVRRGPSQVAPLRFTARLSKRWYWALTISGPTGVVFRTADYSRKIDVTWNGHAPVLPAGRYTWRLKVPRARGFRKAMPLLDPWRVRARPDVLAVTQGAVNAGGLASLARRGDGDVLDVVGAPTQLAVTGIRSLDAAPHAAIRDVGAYLVTTTGGTAVDVELWDWRNGGWLAAGSCTTRAGKRCHARLVGAPASVVRYDADAHEMAVRARFTGAGRLAVDEARVYVRG